MASNHAQSQPSSEPADPAAHLELLDRTQAVVDRDRFYDFGPPWYAPLFATIIGGFSLVGEGAGTALNTAFVVVALAATAALAGHDQRRRRVHARPTTRGFGYTVLAAAIILALVVAWGVAVSTMGYDRFMPGYALLGWALTTAVLLIIRSGLHAIRNRRTVLQ